jgi:hypothetical protein
MISDDPFVPHFTIFPLYFQKINGFPVSTFKVPFLKELFTPPLEILEIAIPRESSTYTGQSLKEFRLLFLDYQYSFSVHYLKCVRVGVAILPGSNIPVRATFFIYR